MKKCCRLFLAAVLSVAVCLVLSSCGGLTVGPVKGSGIVTGNKPIPPEQDAVKLKAEEYSKYSYSPAAENSRFRLLYDKENNTFQVESKMSGKTWDATLDFLSQGLKLSSTWKANVSSLFNISYSLPNENGRDRIITTSLRREETWVWTSPLENGIRLQYYLPSRELGFTAEILLDENGISVSIPPEEVIENNIYRLVSIQPLPFFGAAAAEEEGYILVPYKSGALLRFDPQKPGTYKKLPVYADENTDLNQQSKLEEQPVDLPFSYDDSAVANLPLVGLKSGSQAFVSYISSGDEDANVQVSTSGYGVRFNRAGFELLMRNTSIVEAYNLSGNYMGSSGLAELMIVDKDLIPTKKVIRYELMEGDNIRYGDMATVYREHLTESNLVSAEQKLNPSICVEILMGTTLEQAAGNSLIKTTTLEQASMIVDRLYEGGIRDAVINLRGWNKNGVNAIPTVSKLDTRLGKKKDLDELASHCRELGYILLLEANTAEVNTKFSAFSPQKSAIRNNSGFIIKDTSGMRYLRNLPSVKTATEGLIQQFSNTGVSGFSYQYFGNSLFRDYNGTVTYSSDTAAQFATLMKQTRDTMGTAAARGTNQYILSACDLLWDVPIEYTASTQYDECVPFYQMAVGTIPMTAAPVNTFYDHTVQKLKLVEYNLLPSFEVAAESIDELQNSDYNTLFSAKFDNWLDDILQYYNEFDALRSIRGKVLTDHERLSDDLIRLRYENGNEVIINYGEAEAVYETDTVPARSFRLLSKS